MRALDDDLRHGGLLQKLHQRLADADVFMEELTVLVLARDPTAVPRPVDAEAQADGIDLLTHSSLLRPSLRLRER